MTNQLKPWVIHFGGKDWDINDFAEEFNKLPEEDRDFIKGRIWVN